MELTQRQIKIVEIIKEHKSIKGEEIAEKLCLTRSALRTDFSILVNSNIIKSKQKIGYVYNEESRDKKDIKEKNIKNENINCSKTKKNYIYEIMSKPITVDYNMSIYETILFIFHNDVGTLFITKNNALVGLVSRKDLLKSTIGEKNIENIPINVIMTRMPNIVLIKENDEIISGVEKIINQEIDSLPVVREYMEEEKIMYLVVGRVTKTNITKLYLEENK
ncbi:MAG: CBS domain-containing protein [Fusobacteriaceae bacterium]